jgi:peptidoglycan/LPS O-acetylase OafA/YrhL
MHGIDSGHRDRGSTYHPLVRRALLVIAVDLAMIVVFVLLGRGAHDEGGLVGGTLTIAAPFLIGYAVAAAVLRLDRAPLDLARATRVWGLGMALGFLLRGTAFDRGLAPTFVVVALVVTAFLVLGWRMVAARIAAGRDRAPG